MSVKTVATFAIIIGCFAVLYPKFLHPMMTRLFGLQSKSAHDVKDGGSPYYPPGRRPEEKRPPNMPTQHSGDARQHMRPGPHPGMRAAADMHRAQSQHGSGRGMMGIVLPMYAVGIVLYLVYTLVKVFGKKENNMQSEDSYQPRLLDYPPPPLSTTPLTAQQKTKELQNLLLKADDKSISNEEMKELQKRLEETEQQMSKILQAMQLVQNKIDPDVKGQTETCQEKSKSPDSSPDMDSYEIVNKSGKSDEQKGGSNSTIPDIDSVSAEQVEKPSLGPSQDAGKGEKANMPLEATPGCGGDGEKNDGGSCEEVKGNQEDGRGVVENQGVIDNKQEDGSGVVEDQGVIDNKQEDGSGVVEDQGVIDNKQEEVESKDEDEHQEGGVEECQEDEEVVLHSSDEDSNVESNVRHRQVPPQSFL